MTWPSAVAGLVAGLLLYHCCHRWPEWSYRRRLRRDLAEEAARRLADPDWARPLECYRVPQHDPGDQVP